MNTAAENFAVARAETLHAWRPLFWEPVTGTGERILAGVLYSFQGQNGVAKLLRDEVLDGMFGKQSGGAKRLIEHALASYLAVADAYLEGSLQSEPALLGLYAGQIRRTSAESVTALLRTAALLYSSLSNLSQLEELDQADVPLPEETNRRFSSEVKDVVLERRHDLLRFFGRSTELVAGGHKVRFGFCSERSVVHFTVLHPSRISASIRDARARLFELQGARSVANLNNAGLISAISRPDDATLSDRQRAAISTARNEVEAEADAWGIRYFPVTTAAEGAERLLQLA